jgi:hypothetical protein
VRQEKYYEWEEKLKDARARVVDACSRLPLSVTCKKR